ncbi:MAG TPA: glycosyl hydrolase [Verrucomicrobiae bacterium]|nr:glycosyl hydrolase [Verrucomicrobiae bacterium]
MFHEHSLREMNLRNSAIALVITCLGSVQLSLFAEQAAAVSSANNAVAAATFLDSIGTLSAISKRGENLEKTIECCRYLGIRWLRAGIEGNVPLDEFIRLHKETGVRFSWGFGSGSSDIGKLIETARPVAAADALLAFEGPNEPNNWGITYQGEAGGRGHSWMPVAKLQRDLYQVVKSDPVLMKYPVWSISEVGAETDNVGLQFLTIPEGANTLMPAGTKYADFANVHNYIYHPNSSHPADNKTWNAADPTAACKVDGLYGEYGTTWAHHYRGYSEKELLDLPRVTTETGTTIGGEITEEMHGLNLLTMYLDQFKRGWSYTAVYLLRDRVDEGGNQKFGFYRPDYTPRPAAVYLHNLTTILSDNRPAQPPGKLDYSIPAEPATVHDLFLQKSNGAFELLVWNEQLKGSTPVKVNLGRTIASLRIYHPITSASSIQTLTSTDSVSLNMSNHPVVLELAP